MQSNIESITNGESGDLYKRLLQDLKYEQASLFVKNAYSKYKLEHKSNPSINGRIFEYLICETLAQEGISHFYYQAIFERVPNAEFDIILYHRNQPIVLTMKTSLRERYKQADLEGMALRQVYRRAQTYLITLSDEAYKIREKISNGDISGLDDCIIAKDDTYNSFLKQIKGRKFEVAKRILPIEGVLFSD